jgi:iduronate 2-sulfatase
VDALTPALDALAAESMVFTRAYCQAPQCNPSRSSFLTGYSPDVARVFSFEATARENMGARASMTVFDTMRSHGYLVLGTGKLFHFDPPRGTFSSENGGFFPGSYDQEWGCNRKQKPGHCKAQECRLEGPCPNGRLYLEKTDTGGGSKIFDVRVAAKGVSKIEQAGAAWRANGTRSLVAIGFHHPHLKWYIPKQLWHSPELQPALRAVEPPRFNSPPLGAPFFAHGDVSIAGDVLLVNGGRSHISEPAVFRPENGSAPSLRFNFEAPSTDAQVEMRRAYVSCVAFLDKQVGKVLEALKAQGPKFDLNTVVIFTSDHGFGLGEGGHWGKSSLYEVDTRVPFIVRDPSFTQARNKQSGLLVELVDLYPSIIDLAGLPHDDIMRSSFEGRSVKVCVFATTHR